MLGMNDNHETISYQEGSTKESSSIRASTILKWIVGLFIIIYILISYYHAPILTHLGRYLILEHPPERSDLIVCMGGGNIERGLSTADAYKEGLAPKIYISKVKNPDGYELLEEKGIEYPVEGDLLENLLLDLGVPKDAIIRSDSEVDNTWDEVRSIKEEVEKKGFKSIIIITSPIHTRRCWLVFRKLFEGSDVRGLSLPSKYSRFKAEDWWKDRGDLRDVLFEYEKLLYYKLKNHI
jgi:uncharacterized SAM-binding protein YcdF (DUF218 family)